MESTFLWDELNTQTSFDNMRHAHPGFVLPEEESLNTTNGFSIEDMATNLDLTVDTTSYATAPSIDFPDFGAHIGPMMRLLHDFVPSRGSMSYTTEGAEAAISSSVTELVEGNDMQPLLPGNAMSITYSAPIEHDSSVQNMLATMTPQQTRTRTGRAKLLASSSTPTCPACNETFSVPKSLTRHLRTVHQRKGYSCPDCDIKFMRKDTLDRHIQYTHNGAKKQCSSCGRWVSPRAFEEHLDSLVCRRSRTATRNTCSDERRLGVPGAEDDPFLITLQMTSLMPFTVVAHEKIGDLWCYGPRHKQAPKQYREWCMLNSRALQIMNKQIGVCRNVPSRIAAFFHTATLLAAMCAGIGDVADANGHVEGASALLEAYRRLTFGRKSSRGVGESSKKSFDADPASAMIRKLVETRKVVSGALSITQTKANNVLHVSC